MLLITINHLTALADNNYTVYDWKSESGKTICHGPAGVPRLATRCLCVLSTWLVVCLVPCAPMSIACPLPSCYLIIVSVAPAVSPSLPSFVSLYSLLMSAILCWSVVFRVSYVTCEFCVWLHSSLLPACLFFPFGVVFVVTKGGYKINGAHLPTVPKWWLKRNKQ